MVGCPPPQRASIEGGDGTTAGTTTVKYKTSGGNATAGTDYTAVALATLTFAPGETTKTITVEVSGDRGHPAGARSVDRRADSPDPAKVSTNVTYTVRVTNNGPRRHQGFSCMTPR